MGHAPTCGQFHWCSHLCGCGFPGVGNTTRAGSGIARCDRRAVRLDGLRAPSLCCFFCVESELGSVHPRPETMANWHPLAIDNSDLADCSGNRFRTPLTMIGETSPFHSLSRPANPNSLDLILIFGVPVEECLDFQFVGPATQAAPELSLKPKVEAAKTPS